MDKQRLTSNIESILTALDDEARNIARSSQDMYYLDAKPGTSKPNFGEYAPADDISRQHIREACERAYAKIMKDLDQYVEGAELAMSKPASAGDVATVQFTLGREDVTRAELQALLDRYKDNYQLSVGILERAHAAGFTLDNEPERTQLHRREAEHRAARVLNRYGTASVYPAELVARDIVDKLHHIDAFGRAYL